MLSELTISNFAIIERQSLSFHPGFNVISGETGAGKSIILNALEFILGGKLSASTIRGGAENLEVQALFDLSDVPQNVRLELPDMANGDELVVSRTLPREGRGKIFINGRLGTVSLLEEIVRKLVNICSQHHHTRLLDARYHLELLDGFCSLEPLLSEMREAHRAWSEKNREITAVRDAQARSAARRQDLEELLAELVKLPRLKAGRRVELEGEIKRLGNAERLIDLGQRVLSGIAGDEGISTQLKEVAGGVHEMRRLDPGFEAVASAFDDACATLAESEISIEGSVSSLEVDGDALEDLRLELSELAKLERKHRQTDEGLCALREKASAELELLLGGEGLSSLEKEVARLAASMEVLALKVRKIRQKGAKELSTLVGKDLKELNMRDAVLEVKLSECDPTPSGFDRAEFLIATNRGDKANPLAQIASGGELSRVMLVLKKLLRERSGVNVLIFDEVDTGISGGVARSVGQMLKEISQQSQVVCITHLPQVASLSDRHFLVNKELGERAVTVVKQLSADEKVDEIARMLAGYEITDTSRASARELIASK
jgi:DNA repair protein RecN (Recombination protein N)